MSGHYWAYIYSRPHGRWLKFNDIAVTDASWAELWREGAGGGGGAGGGMRHTSAYCLMYVDSRSDDLFKGDAPRSPCPPRQLSSLSVFLDVHRLEVRFLPVNVSGRSAQSVRHIQVSPAAIYFNYLPVLTDVIMNLNLTRTVKLRIATSWAMVQEVTVDRMQGTNNAMLYAMGGSWPTVVTN